MALDGGHDLSVENLIRVPQIFPSGTGTRRISRIHDSADSIDTEAAGGVTPRTVLATLGDLTTWHSSGDLKPMVVTMPLCVEAGVPETIEVHLAAERPDGTRCDWREISANALGWCVMVIRGRSVLDWFSLDSISSVLRVNVPEQSTGVLKIILVKRLVNDEFEALPVIPVLALPGNAAEDMITIFNKMAEAMETEQTNRGGTVPGRVGLCQQVWVDYYRHLLWDIDAFLDGLWTDSDPDMDPETFESVMDTVLSYLLGVEAHHAAAYLLCEAQKSGWQVNFQGSRVQSISAEYLRTLTERNS